MSRIKAFHGTWSPEAPHEYGGSIHIGTRQAASDRLLSGEGVPEGYGHFQVVHSYEFDDADVDPITYSDPHFGDTYKNIWGNDPIKPLPENSKKITKYLNDHEDRGSTSYVLPKGAVESGMAKHLGAQWDIDPEDSRNAPIVQAYKTMTGAK